MRFARAADHWKRVFRRPYAVQCTEVSYENLLGLGNGAIRFSGGINAVVGGNGVGKSTLVAAAAELFGGEIALAELDHEQRLKGSALEGVVLSGEKEYRIAISTVDGARTVVGGLPEGFGFAWLDPAYQTAKTRSLIAKDAAFAEVLESLGARRLSEDELETLNYVVGKTYEACEVFEVPEYGGIEQFPYFRVKSGGVTYGSEMMGQGELSLMFVIWEILNLPRNSVLLLEEPETHVSPRSQEALMNVLARAADENATWTVVTTHSPVIVSKIPKEHVRLLARGGGKIVVINAPERYQMAAVLGGDFGFRGAALVEDECAKQLLIALLEEVDPDLLRQFEVIAINSNDAIGIALRSMPRTRNWFCMVGVFDGDQRDKLAAVDQFKWPYTFLPGAAMPERLLLDVMNEVGPAAMSGEIGCKQDALVAAIEATKGTDAHDQIHGIANLAGVGFDRLIRHLVTMWLRTGDRKENYGELVAALRSAQENP